MDNQNADTFPAPYPTLVEILAELARFTPAQRSLAWSPQPPYVSTGAHDCRIGGDGGLDFNRETPRARWVQARYRWRRELPQWELEVPLRSL